MELVQVLWNGVRIHLDVRESLCVALEVHLQIAFGRESIAANVALEGTFARVRSNVNLKGRIAAKDFTTVATSMFKQLILFATRATRRSTSTVASVS